MAGLVDIPSPVKLRGFDDVPAIRQNIFDSVLQTASSIKPVANTRFSLSIEQPQYAGPEVYSKKDWKRALLSGKSLTRKLVGNVVLTDLGTGQPVANRRTTLADVPYLTDHGTFVHNGSEYGMGHQFRQSSGIYARRKTNGEIESHVNVLPGQGWSHRVFMDPATGVFKLRLDQANIPLKPILKAFGATDAQLREAWGPEVAQSNSKASDARSLNKLYSKLVRQQDPNADDTAKSTAVVQALSAMKVSPEVTRRTLGHPHDTLGLPVYMAITKKLLDINRGVAEPDTRDALGYRTIHGPEDILAERLGKDQQPLRQLLWKATARGNLNHVSAGVFNPTMTQALLNSGLTNNLEEVNNLELLDNLHRVTSMGVGAIGDVDAVPAESRNIHPSQYGFVDTVRTPESSMAGIELRLARWAKKGADGRLYTPVKDARTGQLSYKSPQELADTVLGFPYSLQRGTKHVNVIRDGQLDIARRRDVTHIIPHGENTFSPVGNMIPLKSMVAGQRAVMGSRMLTQALSLKDPEAPFVRSGLPESAGKSFEEEYGKHAGAIRAEQPGWVVGVEPDSITVRHADGTTKQIELHQNHVYNRKSFLHQTPAVQVGQQVKEGELLATSNFTDKQGHVALGKNARVAYIPDQGWNYEDAISISESMARRLTSQHAYQHEAEFGDSHKLGKNNFIAAYPGLYTKEQLKNFDDEGVIKPGTQVNFGDPLILALEQKDNSYGQLHRGRGPSFNDASITWEHHSPGTVTDAVPTKKGFNVVVKSEIPFQVGDKLSGRYGDKGLVGRIIPDDQMPTDSKGRPFEVLANPLGLISRGNPAQAVEAALGKITEQTGISYSLPDFQHNQDYLKFAQQELTKHGLNSAEDVIDPETGRKIPSVLVGNRFFMKLHHQAAAKGQGRGIAGYTADGAPAKGGVDGAKRVGMLSLNALLSHGAEKVISDTKLVKGQANPEYWSRYTAGFDPPTPRVPFVYHKFVAHLQGAGIHPVREGTRTQLMAMTDADVDRLAGDRELQNAGLVHWDDNQRPVKGGLFDEALFGNPDDLSKWGKISLHEPMPNPVMAEPIRRVLNLTENQFRDVLAGRENIGGDTGPQALKNALSQINVPQEILKARIAIAGTKKGARDAAIRRIGFLKAAERTNTHPQDWMLTRMPVLPPSFRPVSALGPEKLPLVSDPNYLYQELFDANHNLRELSQHTDDLGDERLALYDSMKAVTGLGDPTNVKNQERRVKGLLAHVFNNSPKYGMVQRKLLGTTTDLVGRAVITPNPNFDMDTVGLPEDKAWSVYAPFVTRSLVKRGLPRLAAVRAVADRTAEARKVLLGEMSSRPVMIDRAPVLHKYSVMAAWPQIVKGDAMQLSPTVVGGFGADFDGDMMNYAVLGSDRASQELAEKMLPSRNLFSAARMTSVQYSPSQEYLGGLYAASAENSQKPTRVFVDGNAVRRAYYRGEINADDPIEIRNQ